MHFIVLNRLFIRPSAIIRAVSAKWKSSENSLVNLTFGAVMDLDKDSVLRPTSDAATQCFQTSREESMFVCRQCFSGPESDGEEEQPSVESDPPPSNSQEQIPSSHEHKMKPMSQVKTKLGTTNYFERICRYL
ncbi:uncharacterized protein LOC106673148 isoform X6 [Cimex lectularius]|uniref:Uncharacterized protein n=1 Tax=Cimex lectularius TaxID=79782 RepID=A0A8I6SL71_CIMLE|nr:uncharacterized protein LOC106673148 isoform X6 [Cimex lectularius]